MKRFLDLLNGHKTHIAGIFFLIQLRIIPIWFPNGVPPTLEMVLMTITEVAMYIGVGHAAVKFGSELLEHGKK